LELWKLTLAFWERLEAGSTLISEDHHFFGGLG
jgi:hypothetical protein